ncbi:hypothetical protein K491DRAFT_784667 [Lophiostoma macrostomum CBS 122681]|uniref:Uncharacterized protein n=1 Tax=Lophiostoma macrostomum CBS 122681 TaxID=1314788 RepID=A0A6A6SMZ2_9PLEO|nr:hypothetical protein K491DRAFT_784667 [Lophiostoma macrostomum CBS 122681]
MFVFTKLLRSLPSVARNNPNSQEAPSPAVSSPTSGESTIDGVTLIDTPNTTGKALHCVDDGDGALEEIISQLGGGALCHDIPAEAFKLFADEEYHRGDQISYKVTTVSRDSIHTEDSMPASRESANTVRRHPRLLGPVSSVSPPASLLIESVSSPPSHTLGPTYSLSPPASLLVERVPSSAGSSTTYEDDEHSTTVSPPSSQGDPKVVYEVTLTRQVVERMMRSSEFMADTLDLIDLIGKAMAVDMVKGLSTVNSIVQQYNFAWEQEAKAERNANSTSIQVADKRIEQEQWRHQIVNNVFRDRGKQQLCKMRANVFIDIKIPREVKRFPEAPRQMNPIFNIPRFRREEQLVPGRLRVHPHGHAFLEPTPEFIDILSASVRMSVSEGLAASGGQIQQIMEREMRMHRARNAMPVTALVCVFRLAEEDFHWLDKHQKCEWNVVAKFSWKCNECGQPHAVKVYH